MFADDLLVKCKAKKDDALAVKRSLDPYFRWSGQEANLNKSSILFSKNTRKEDCSVIKDLFEFKDMAKNSVYLGNSLLLSWIRNMDFKAFKDRISQRLEGWNRNLL